MKGAADGLINFARQLNDYADRLEHAQHEHWLQIGIMGVLTVVSVAQLGLDPLTDAAAVGIGAATSIGVPFVIAQVGAFALEGALVNFASDVIAQIGADAWDHLDGQFDHTGDHTVAFFDGQEAATSALQGAVSFGLARSGGALLDEYGGNAFTKALLNPWARTATVGAFSTATEAASQMLTTGQVNWEQAAISGGIGGLAGGHVWRAEDVGSVEALGRFHDPTTADPSRYDALKADPAHGGKVKTGMGGGHDEAVTVMRLEHAGFVDGPVSRSPDPTADYVDIHNMELDVKTPQDRYPGKGMYTLPGTLHDLSEEVRNGQRPLLNIRYLTRAHARELIIAVKGDPQLAGKVLFSTSA
jgi:hypothetical protein